MKTVADTLGVSRSQLHSRLREGSRPRGRYQKTGDAETDATAGLLTVLAGVPRGWGRARLDLAGACARTQMAY